LKVKLFMVAISRNLSPEPVAPGHMKIGELAAAAGVAPSAIRFYEQSGLLPSAPRTAGGYRLYGEDALVRVRVIQLAQRLGFSLESIRAVFAPTQSATPGGVQGFDKMDLLARLDDRLMQVDGLLAEIKAQKRELQSLRETLATTWERGDCVDPNELLAIKNIATEPARMPTFGPKSSKKAKHGL
jgi:MerR family transcriptional regulator, copper efflux regulator